MKSATVLTAAVAAERAQPKARKRRGDELAFLPAALEVAETPPSPGARWLALTLASFLAIAIGWAWFGHVDVIAVADGRTIPTGKSKVIQPADTGIVRAIHVRDGSIVKQGDVLIELDATSAEAERERLAQDLLTMRITSARLRALLADPVPQRALDAFVAPAEADPLLVQSQRSLLESEAWELQARLAQLGDELARKRSERATVEATARRIEASIPLLAERTAARKQLADQGWGSRLQFLDEQRQLTDAQEERKVQTARIGEIEAGLHAIESQRRSIEAEFRRTRTAELADADRKAVGFRQELIKAEQRHQQQTLTAPIDGVVQQLAIHTIGGVVQPAQPLLVVVPSDGGLEIEAKLLNRDVGFVRPGQPAEVKLETFNFTRYGLVPGEVVSVSGDAIQDEKLGQVYAARIRLASTTITVDGREVALGPGMNATVEIRTDERRVIEFLLSPLLKYRQEALRER